MNYKYYFHSDKFLKILFVAVVITYIFIRAAYGMPADPNQTVINDNSTAIYKTLKISSDLCVKYLNDCKHEVYVNGLFSGYFREGDVLQVPDGSDVVIGLDDPINTNLELSYDNGKSFFTIALMYFIGPIIIILIIYLLIIFTLRRHGRRRRW